ncbi:MAG: hypothetical protein LBJ09_03820 [Clostridiales bacterium]|nr:hypothetical protein [Clostridiales bacterium]
MSAALNAELCEFYNEKLSCGLSEVERMARALTDLNDVKNIIRVLTYIALVLVKDLDIIVMRTMFHETDPERLKLHKNLHEACDFIIRKTEEMSESIRGEDCDCYYDRLVRYKEFQRNQEKEIELAKAVLQQKEMEEKRFLESKRKKLEEIIFRKDKFLAEQIYEHRLDLEKLEALEQNVSRHNTRLFIILCKRFWGDQFLDHRDEVLWIMLLEIKQHFSDYGIILQEELDLFNNYSRKLHILCEKSKQCEEIELLNEIEIEVSDFPDKSRIIHDFNYAKLHKFFFNAFDSRAKQEIEARRQPVQTQIERGLEILAEITKFKNYVSSSVSGFEKPSPAV